MKQEHLAHAEPPECGFSVLVSPDMPCNPKLNRLSYRPRGHSHQGVRQHELQSAGEHWKMAFQPRRERAHGLQGSSGTQSPHLGVDPGEHLAVRPAKASGESSFASREGTTDLSRTPQTFGTVLRPNMSRKRLHTRFPSISRCFHMLLGLSPLPAAYRQRRTRST